MGNCAGLVPCYLDRASPSESLARIHPRSCSWSPRLGNLNTHRDRAAPAAQQARPWVPALLGAQITVIGQTLRPFDSPYRGPNSLDPAGATLATHSYGVYGGMALAPWLQVYLDGEMALGQGVGTGLAGLTNGDVIRQGSVELAKAPYIARVFLKALIPVGTDTQRVGRGQDQLPGIQPRTRLEAKVGKLAASDDFDQNRYANSTRTQFMNWGLWNNSAWDFAADTRGYSWGLVVAWVRPAWEVRLGSYMMPTFANGNVFDGDLARAGRQPSVATSGSGSRRPAGVGVAATIVWASPSCGTASLRTTPGTWRPAAPGFFWATVASTMPTS